MNPVQEKLKRLYEMQFPKGISWKDADVDIEVFEYAAHILGYTSRYLKGDRIDPEKIKIDPGLNQRIEQVIQILIELREYKKQHDELVREVRAAMQPDLSGNIESS